MRGDPPTADVLLALDERPQVAEIRPFARAGCCVAQEPVPHSGRILVT